MGAKAALETGDDLQATADRSGVELREPVATELDPPTKAPKDG
jgi:hypothetical protein